MALPILVTAYSGYKPNERPCTFIIDEDLFDIAQVLGSWRDPSFDKAHDSACVHEKAVRSFAMNGTTVRRSPGRKGTWQAESESKLHRTVAEVLKAHVELKVKSIDRTFLNVFVPRLQIVEGALHFIRHQCKSKVLSTTIVYGKDGADRSSTTKDRRANSPTFAAAME